MVGDELRCQSQQRHEQESGNFDSASQGSIYLLLAVNYQGAQIVESPALAQSDNSATVYPHTCLVCKSKVRPLVDFGPQPPSNRFEFVNFHESDRHPLTIGQCEGCGLVQLISPMAPDMVKPRFEWLIYNEPENHLDTVVERLCRLSDIDTSKRVVGLTYKDDTSLARFNRAGYRNIYRYDPAQDLGVKDGCASLETIQGALAATPTSQLAAKHGLADLLLARHVLEHAHDPVAFLAAISNLVAPGGYLIFEVPDCTKFVGACDYSFVWEEHVTYFSPETLAALINHAGLTLHEIFTYPYPYEDALIAIVRNTRSNDANRSKLRDIRSLLSAGEVFSHRYAEVAAQIQRRLRALRRSGKRIAIFGAGHLAAKFINLYSLGELIDCVIDDHERKREMLMPASRVPIRSAAALKNVDICLLSLSPESEEKVVAQRQEFREGGGQFMSIFARNARSIYSDTVK
jgi:SAM-dependent methyltransferase